MDSITDIDSETANATRSFIEKVASRYDLAGAILFGSRARKSHRPDSDADGAVLLHGSPGKFVATKLAMADLAYDVLLETGIRIQPLPIWEEEWEHPEAYSNPQPAAQHRARRDSYMPMNYSQLRTDATPSPACGGRLHPEGHKGWGRPSAINRAIAPSPTLPRALRAQGRGVN